MLVSMCLLRISVSAENNGVVTYTISNGEVTIIECLSKKVQYLSIDGTIDGYPITKIEKNAFANCFLLSYIKLPSTLKYIGESAFDGCNSLTNLKIPDSVQWIGKYAFRYCSFHSIEIPDSVTSIGEGAFIGCNDLTDVKLSNNITIINAGLFSSCSKLTSIIIPDSVRYIYSRSFSNCDSLIDITIPENMVSIGQSAFYSCDNLREVTMYDKITRIQDYAFMSCTKLKKIQYIGDKEKFDSINIGSENYYFTSATKIFYEGTKTTVSNDGKSFNIKPINIDTGNTIIHALYDNDCLVDAQTAIYEGDEIQFTTTESYTDANVMVWSDLTNMIPVCTAETLDF